VSVRHVCDSQLDILADPTDKMLVDEIVNRNSVGYNLCPVPWNPSGISRIGDIHIVLHTVDNDVFYQTYSGIKIAYLLFSEPVFAEKFLSQLRTFNFCWVPSEWHKQQLVSVGIEESFISVIEFGRTDAEWKLSAQKTMQFLLPMIFSDSDDRFCFYTSLSMKECLSDTTDDINRFFFREIFKYNIYDNNENMQILPGDVVVDIGAHIGIFSRYAALKGASKVIAFEMNPQFFLSLRQNVRVQDDVFNCIILDKNYSKFKIDNNVIINGFDLNHFFEGRLLTVVDFLKIDVMGKEEVLLKNIPSDVYGKIKKISIKLYDSSEETKNRIVEFMSKSFSEKFVATSIPEQPVQFVYFWK
jgi:hypothetical protein